MIREGYIERLIRQMVELMASVFARREKGDRLGARKELERGYALILGTDPSVVDFIDARSLLTLFGPAQRLRALAGLMRAEAILLLDEGEADRAQRRLRQALELFDLVGVESDEEREALADVKARLGAP